MPPFNDETVEKIFENIIGLKVPWDQILEDDIDPQAKDLIKKILVAEPEKRPSLEEIKRHPFFESCLQFH